MAGFYGKSMFNFLRNFFIMFQSGWTILHPPAAYEEFSLCYILVNTQYVQFT